MSTFIEHTSCPQCGSKDNLAVYTDHEWCFGCGYWKKTGVDYEYRHQLNEPDQRTIIYLPEDVSTAYPGLAEDWIKKYELSINTLYKNYVLWSESRKLLIFPIYDDKHNLWGWQGRYFGEDKTHPKWTSKGKYKDLIQIFNSTKAKESGIIVVEDLISAVKLSQEYATTCLYGSYVDTAKFININNIYEPRELILWLDHDKRKESYGFSIKLNNIGIKTRSIISIKDPKEYSLQDIKTML
jgi:Zn ribbon nucleic-acid-binding protein